MALDPALQVRRIKAAIALAGLTQQQFSDRIEALGVNKSALGLMVRADRKPPPKQKIPEMDYATAVCMGQVAEVPPEWFTEPDLSKMGQRSRLMIGTHFLRAKQSRSTPSRLE